MLTRLWIAVGLAVSLALAAPAVVIGATSAVTAQFPAASEDPCAPNADGTVPPMCQTGAPIDPSGPLFSATFTQLVTGDATSRHVFDVSRGSIDFAAGQLTASVGCNTLNAQGALELDGMHLTLAAPIAATKMYCEGLMEAESALVAILEGGDLMLTNDGITGASGLIRIDGGVHPAMPGGVNPGDGFAPNDAGAPIVSITVDGVTYDVAHGTFSLGGGRLAASVGCNGIGGDATLDGDSIVISGGLVQTEMYCEGLMEAEGALSAVLNGAHLRFSAAYTISSDAGSFTIAPTLCGPGCPPAPSTGSSGSMLFSVLLLLLPVVLIAWLALRRRGVPNPKRPGAKRRAAGRSRTRR